MNIEKAKLDKEGLDMSIQIPLTSKNNEYMENLSNTEGLRFSDILNKMIIEHKKRGFTNDGEEFTERSSKGLDGDKEHTEKEEKSPNKKAKDKRSKDGSQ